VHGRPCRFSFIKTVQVNVSENESDGIRLCLVVLLLVLNYLNFIYISFALIISLLHLICIKTFLLYWLDTNVKIPFLFVSHCVNALNVRTRAPSDGP